MNQAILTVFAMQTLIPSLTGPQITNSQGDKRYPVPSCESFHNKMRATPNLQRLGVHTLMNRTEAHD